MKQTIVPHLWFNKEAVEATALYVSLFPNSQITSTSRITGTPSGDCDLVSFTLAGQEFMAISAGPYFTLNPSISLFTVFQTEREIEVVWNKLAEGGKVLMPYDTYPWATKYGWVEDKYGVSWQLSLSENHQMEQTITPAFMFTGAGAGKTQEALQLYTSIFKDSSIDLTVPYGKDEGDVEGYIKHARFTLAGQNFIAMDSSAAHQFTFNEAFSLIVKCETQEEIDYYWEKLSTVPEAEQCGWCKDTYGISWQVTPLRMDEMMRDGTQEQKDRVTQAFLQMKKFDLQILEKTYSGE